VDFSQKMLAISRILAVFFSFHNNSANLDISRNCHQTSGGFTNFVSGFYTLLLPLTLPNSRQFIKSFRDRLSSNFSAKQWLNIHAVGDLLCLIRVFCDCLTVKISEQITCWICASFSCFWWLF